MTILDRFTAHLTHVIGQAYGVAKEYEQERIEPLHLLLALTLERGSVAEEILARVRITPDAIRAVLTALPRPKDASASEGTPLLTSPARRAIEKAVLTAATHEHRYVGTEHLLAGLLAAEDAGVARVLDDRRVEPDVLHQHLTIVYRSTAKFPEITTELEAPEHAAAARDDAAGGQPQKTPALDFFAKDLTAPAAASHLDPVIGREAEIERAIQILCRRTKNNPILLGEPGVGKTAIVEGLARKIIERDVPDVLIGKRILALDLALLVAGTIYRGEFESRLKQLVDEIKQDPNIILFIDEIHMIMGAGAASGSLDAANILKPALAKGDIRCIGATTYAEFKKHVENDPALERRFQAVHVSEPTAEATTDILRGLKPHYEKFHRVEISDDAVRAAVRLAERYLPDRRFPDKAIDLMDEAAARVRVQLRNDPLLRRANAVDASLEDLETRKRQAVAEDRFSDAVRIQHERDALLREAAGVRAKVSKKRAAKAGAISDRDIAAVIAQILGISADDILRNAHEEIQRLTDELRRRIVGQDDAIAAIASAIRRAKSDIVSPNRPLGSFLLLGPTGVGKTETAKTLAELLFHHKDAFIRLDMSEFSEGFTVSKLIGAPAGYVGYREGSKLTDAVRKRPASVVLFDEIEKAHPDIWNLLLQILEDGRVTDATGREVSFTNAIIVLTSNIGASAFASAGIGFLSGAVTPERLATQFDDIRQDALRELRQRFRPELLNRIDVTAVYRPLTREHLTVIAERTVRAFTDRLAGSHALTTSVDPGVHTWIAERAFDPMQGARAVRRLVQEHIENPIASGIIARQFLPNHTLRITELPDRSGIAIAADAAPASERAPRPRTVRKRATANV